MSSFCLRQIETRCDDEKFFNIECRRGGCEELSVVRQTIAMWDAAALLGGLTNYFPIDNPTQLNLTPLRAWYFWHMSYPFKDWKTIHSNVWKYATKLFYDKRAKKHIAETLSMTFTEIQIALTQQLFSILSRHFRLRFWKCNLSVFSKFTIFWQKPKTLNLIGSLSQIAFN